MVAILELIPFVLFMTALIIGAATFVNRWCRAIEARLPPEPPKWKHKNRIAKYYEDSIPGGQFDD